MGSQTPNNQPNIMTNFDSNSSTSVRSNMFGNVAPEQTPFLSSTPRSMSQLEDDSPAQHSKRARSIPVSDGEESNTPAVENEKLQNWKIGAKQAKDSLEKLNKVAEEAFDCLYDLENWRKLHAFRTYSNDESLKKENDLLKKMIEKMGSKVNESHSKVTSLETDNVHLKHKVARLGKDMDAIKTENAAIKTENADIKRKLAKLEENNAVIKTQLEAIIAKLTEVSVNSIIYNFEFKIVVSKFQNNKMIRCNRF